MSKRELIDTGTDKRYVRRDEKGQFKESVDVGTSCPLTSVTRRSKMQKAGEGDKGNYKRK